MSGPTERVRDVFRRNAGALTISQLATLSGVSKEEVRSAVYGLVLQNEVRHTVEGNAHREGQYERTPHLRTSGADLAAMRFAAERLQRLALLWGSRRPNDRRDCHASAD